MVIFMVRRFLLSVALVLTSAIVCAEGQGLTYLSTADFKSKVCYYSLDEQPVWKYIGDKPCLIDFSTSWCGWCKKLHPILSEIAELYKGQIYVYTLDAEKEREVAALFGVRSYPTVVLCPMDGAPQIAQGYHEKDYWVEAINTLLLKTK